MCTVQYMSVIHVHTCSKKNSYTCNTCTCTCITCI